MKKTLAGFNSILTLIFLAGLAVLAIAFFSSQSLRGAGPGSSPVATVVGVQTSPLSTRSAADVPVARLGEPLLVHASGPASLLRGDQQKLVSIGRQGDQAFTTLHDLATGQERKIADDVLPNAHLSGHWLVGEDRTPPESPGYYSRIKVIDIDTGKEFFLGDKNTIRQSPSISGDIVVWRDWRNEKQSGTDIYAYDLKAGKEFPVVTAASRELEPRISGQWVTYLTLPTQYPPGEAPNTIELRAHSLKTGEDFSIGMIPSPNNASWGTQHAIDGDKVAWIKVTNATWGQYSSELHLYDLTSRTDRKLTDPLPEGPALDISLSAQSEMVVYNSPAGRWTILDWRPTTPVPLAVTAPLSRSVDFLLVSGDYLVWKFVLDREVTDIQLFAAPITRP